MTASEQAIREAGQVYAAILDDPQRAVEIRAARERYAAELAAQTTDVPASASSTAGSGEAQGRRFGGAGLMTGEQSPRRGVPAPPPISRTA